MNIGIVNDLPLAVEAMRRALAQRPEHRVLWVATDGAQAVELCAAQPPDVVLMDLVMPRFDGIEATRRIMRSERPCAILIVTNSIGANTWRVFEAMGAGALDAVDTPQLGEGAAGDSAKLLLAKIDQIGRQLAVPGAARAACTAGRADGGPLIAIGASAGGPGALASILGGLPAGFSAPIVIVQHVDRAFAEGMAQWLDGQTPLTVRVAREGERPQPGTALLAATDDHLRITRAGTLEYTREPASTPYRPSVDVFFNSLTEHWPGRVIGVLLTGMGRDGAIGLKALRMKGYHTIAQDEATSAVYGMPKAAATLGAARAILPLERIAGELAALARF
ncbi:chemotaxis response regulator protein-glutamate methylesterase [Burkholderia pseudomultivorans]|uniref:Protein-glutamate methylesterase/protein-glutamine glutaminase n=2 Tax=Burkholderia cepacia complex TaxID=87882 RepID=A0AAN0VP63_9BURK|nr:chemotaxis response regulator protein-glutamate methylesterase [Burkholderia pseudomultivorans]AIO34430.1 cheB methylesterase family protein [Burkholderia cenocepacia]AOI88805.1 chemotaxis response regulator protein-glutamate methylesterase [Burkholderia pseudomultivorans]KVC30873.1 chemotaxis response regulator protein-glutamate methylesterase [Burkholderia pseudomultivorans]KVC31125.1 chemotaxis response regulator protein-glutamate methylesterase [Burkholderia pseudomultivorans]KVC35781.1